MKTSNYQSEDTPKSTQNKSTKKSTKSRSKSTKSTDSGGSGSSKNVSSSSANQATTGNQINQVNIQTTPTTPTSTFVGSAMFESSLHGTSGGGGGPGSGAFSSDNNAISRNQHKNYAGLEPRSIKIIWEQHDQSDVELSTEVCARVAEDASYKLWELINNIKTYARHSAGQITYDLVNEVLRDCDVPPCLGAMDSDWDRIDYDGSFFFYSDKIIELRDEYQKEVKFEMSNGIDFRCNWAVEDKHMENLKKYVPNIIYVTLNGNADELDSILTEAAFSPLIGACYRIFLAKIIQILAFKQTNDISLRCWSLLKALACNPQCRDVDCREEYFHLSEILICQLLAPCESIKSHAASSQVKNEEASGMLPQQQQQTEIKLETDSIKLDTDFVDNTQQSIMDQQPQNIQLNNLNVNEKIYKLEPDNDGEEGMQNNDDKTTDSRTTAPDAEQYLSSPYFASPVDWKMVDDLCQTLGYLGALNGYFQSECLHHILRRLKRFFDGRCISTERDYNYISRAVRGLITLGEYAFREFIPFVYKINPDEIPESIWNDFALSATFLQGQDDIYLYEWLAHVCGCDKLQPYLTYYSQYYEKFLTNRFLRRKQATFRCNPKFSVRRLEWSSLAAAMCHGDDPNRALHPKPSIAEMFPELKIPNLTLNKAGNIRFKFAGCRPVILKPKNKLNDPNQLIGTGVGTGLSSVLGQNDIMIARRKLFKPLTNEKRMIPLCSYYSVRI